MKIELKKNFTSDSEVDEFDVRQIKHALNRLGYYAPHKEIGMTDIPDNAVFEALKTFQKNQKLPMTGQVKPDDKTVKALNKAISQDSERQYIWRTVKDGKVRPKHAAFEGALRTWKDSPSPTEDFNCRCWAESVSDIETEELPAPKIPEPTIPGTNIPNRGIPEQGWPGSRKYDPNRDDGRNRATPIWPAIPPNPRVDPRMEIPYDPDDVQIYRDT